MPPLLNPAQARSVRATFTHVSDLLEGVLRVARGDVTAFDRQDADLRPEEARALEALVADLRQRMLTALGELGVAPPEVDGSARWTARTALSFAEIALADLTPHDLGGYGTVGEDAAPVLATISADLRGLIARGQEILD